MGQIPRSTERISSSIYIANRLQITCSKIFGLSSCSNVDFIRFINVTGFKNIRSVLVVFALYALLPVGRNEVYIALLPRCITYTHAHTRRRQFTQRPSVRHPATDWVAYETDRDALKYDIPLQRAAFIARRPTSTTG